MSDSNKNLNEASLKGVAGGEGEKPKGGGYEGFIKNLKNAQNKGKGIIPPSLISGNPNGSGSTPSNS